MNRFVTRTLLAFGFITLLAACGGTEQDIIAEEEAALSREYTDLELQDGTVTYGGTINWGDRTGTTTNVTHGALCSGVSTTCCEGSSYFNTTCTTSEWTSYGYCSDKKTTCTNNGGTWSCPTCTTANR